MCGVHAKKVFTCLKGGKGNHCFSCYGLLILMSLQTLCILLLFSRVAGGIPIQDSLSLLRGLLKDFSSLSPYSGLRPKHLIQLQHSLHWQLGCVVGCCRGGFYHTISKLIFRGGRPHSFGKIVRDVLGLLVDFGIKANSFPAPTMYFIQ